MNASQNGRAARRECWSRRGASVPVRRGFALFQPRPPRVVSTVKCAADTQRRRAGISLIELMVVISTTAALMSFATVLLGLLFRADNAGHDAMGRQQAIAHLGRQLRADVHAATAATVPPEKPGALELELDDGRRVSWGSSAGTVSRITRRGDSSLSRESYVLPEGEIVFSIAGENSVVRFRHSTVPPAVLENSAETMAKPSDIVTIDAAIGISIPATPNTEEAADNTPNETP